MRALKGKRRGHHGPAPQTYVVTRYPTAVASSPVPTNNFAGNPNNANILAEDGALVGADGALVSALHVQSFDFDSQLPEDALITKVEIVVKDKTDGAAPHPRLGVSFRINNIAGTWNEQGDEMAGVTTLTEKVWDLTASGDFATWGISGWSRSALLNANMKVGLRSRNVTGLPGVNSFDSVKVRVTYKGSPPGTGATPRETLNVAAAGDGTGKITGPGIDTSLGDSSESYPYGTQVELLATANPGSLFDGWSGSVSGDENPIRVGMDATKTVDGNFVGTPAGDPVESHLGVTFAEDRATDLDPTVPWRAITDPYVAANGLDADGNPVANPADTPYITRRTDDLSPFVPHGQVSTSTHKRRLTSPLPPIQSVFDAGVIPYPNSGANTRTQLEKWSATDSFVVLEEGDRGFLLADFRVVDPTVLPYDLAEKPGGGNSACTQLFQSKVTVPTGGQDVVWTINAYKDGFRIRTNGGPSPVDTYDLIPCDLTVWQKIGLECLWSSDDSVGYYTLWGKIDVADDAAPWVQLTPKRFVAWLFPGASHGNIGLGPYHKLGIMSDVYEMDAVNVQWIPYI